MMPLATYVPHFPRFPAPLPALHYQSHCPLPPLASLFALHYYIAVRTLILLIYFNFLPLIHCSSFFNIAIFLPLHRCFVFYNLIVFHLLTYYSFSCSYSQNTSLLFLLLLLSYFTSFLFPLPFRFSLLATVCCSCAPVLSRFHRHYPQCYSVSASFPFLPCPFSIPALLFSLPLSLSHSIPCLSPPT